MKTYVTRARPRVKARRRGGTGLAWRPSNVGSGALARILSLRSRRGRHAFRSGHLGDLITVPSALFVQ